MEHKITTAAFVVVGPLSAERLSDVVFSLERRADTLQKIASALPAGHAEARSHRIGLQEIEVRLLQAAVGREIVAVGWIINDEIQSFALVPACDTNVDQLHSALAHELASQLEETLVPPRSWLLRTSLSAEWLLLTGATSGTFVILVESVR